ncbi:unnamed protein product, partial [Scytosiphon promiscuus]
MPDTSPPFVVKPLRVVCRVVQERWIDCTRQLSQWSVLVDFSSTLQYPELMMESAWKARAWDVSVVLRRVVAPVTRAGSEAG